MVYVNARLYYILNISNTNIDLCFLVEAKVVVFSSLTPNLTEEWKIKIKKTVPLKLEGRGAKRRREYDYFVLLRLVLTFVKTKQKVVAARLPLFVIIKLLLIT